MNILSLLHGWNDGALLLMRLALGAVFLAHGTMKWGMWKSPEPGAAPMPMRNVMRFLSIMEPLGGLAVIAGFLTQFAAAGFACIMLGAIWMKMRVWKAPFVGTGSTGWEFDLMNLVALLVLVTAGAGMYSLDHWLLGL